MIIQIIHKGRARENIECDYINIGVNGISLINDGLPTKRIVAWFNFDEIVGFKEIEENDNDN